MNVDAVHQNEISVVAHIHSAALGIVLMVVAVAYLRAVGDGDSASTGDLDQWTFLRMSFIVVTIQYDVVQNKMGVGIDKGKDGLIVVGGIFITRWISVSVNSCVCYRIAGIILIIP